MENQTHSVGIGGGEDEIDWFSSDFQPSLHTGGFGGSGRRVDVYSRPKVEELKQESQPKKSMKTASFGTSMNSIPEDDEEEIITTKST